MSRRLERLNEQLKREISKILRTEVRDPRVGVPTVTGVEVTPDLWMARVYVRLTGSDEEKREAMEGLEAASQYIRRLLGEGLHIRRVPELEFEVDRSLERARRIEEILDEVRPEEGWEDTEEPSEPADGEAGSSGGPEDDAAPGGGGA